MAEGTKLKIAYHIINTVLLIVVSANINGAFGQTDLSSALNHTCMQVRDAFANASSAFSSCSVEHSRPVTFCQACVTQYIDVLHSYRNMSEVTSNGRSCIDNFINLDRLGIVETLYHNHVDLWNRAKCYECFATENGTQTFNKSAQTIKFTELFEEYTNCANTTKDSDVCSICMDKYVTLNKYFLSISNENEKIGVCMDIVDLMNTTWTYWGNECCQFRRHNEVAFIVSAVFVLIGTVLFYVLAQVCSKKKQPTIIEQTRFLNTLES